MWLEFEVVFEGASVVLRGGRWGQRGVGGRPALAGAFRLLDLPLLERTVSDVRLTAEIRRLYGLGRL